MLHTAKLSVWAFDGNGARMVQDDTVLSFPTSADDLAPRHTLCLKNSGAVTVYVGNGNVTDDNGYPLAPGDSLQLELHSFTYVACGSGDTGQVRVLIVLD